MKVCLEEEEEVDPNLNSSLGEINIEFILTNSFYFKFVSKLLFLFYINKTL